MWKSALRRRWRLFALVIAFPALALVAVLATPVPQALQNPPQPSTEFLDRTGKPLRTLLVEQKRYARVCPLQQISPYLINATLSAEDKRFFKHPGVDPLALARAISNMLRGESPASGASTITQQLAKIADPQPRSIKSKLQRIAVALRLEWSWDKQRILAEYLNRLDYGNLQTGIASASRYYFDKPPADLSPAESALLAALPKAPSRLDPYENLEAAVARQRWILHRMAQDGHLDSEALNRALSEPLQFRSRAKDFEAPHFVDLLLSRKGLIPSNGGPLQTTLDLELNRFATDCLEANLRLLADKHATGAAAVVLDNRSGEVLAMAGSGNYFQAGAGQINGAWMVRSPGSTMKPFTYLLALQKGLAPCSVVADVSTEFATPTGSYKPNNYNHRFYGPVTLRFALGNSLNVAAIKTLELAGGPDALQAALRDAGITTLGHPPEYYGLGLTLGNGEVRLLELANAFATLARKGQYRPYRFLLRDDQTLPAPKQVFDPNACFLIADMLSDNGARAASFGLDSFLHFDFPVACKTGTSSDYRDNWTMGYTPEFTVGVWVGNHDGSPMQGITGVTGAAPIFHAIFNHLHNRFGTSWYAQPPAITLHPVDPLTGRSVAPDKPGVIWEKCLTPPEPAQPGDYDAEGRVRLGPEYQQWLASPQNTLGSLVCATQSDTPEILQPVPGTTYYHDGDMPADTQWITLRCAGSQTRFQWECTTLPLQTVAGITRCQLRLGRHEISLKDPTTGRSVTTWIEVKPW